MAIAHLQPADVASVRPLGERLAREMTTTLVKTPRLEVLRVVMPRGKKIRRHEVPGEVTLQCLEGKVNLDVEDRSIELTAGDFTYLDGHRPHDLEAVLDSTLLVTILLVHERKTQPRPWPSVLVAELEELVPVEAWQ
jgi:quercetin dioxygenase-like cupin family protein